MSLSFVGVAWPLSLLAATIFGFTSGQNYDEAQEARDERLARNTEIAAAKGTASVIAAMIPQNKTIIQKVQREIETNTVYRDCRHSPDALRLLNESLTGRQQPSDSKLPGTDTTAQ